MLSGPVAGLVLAAGAGTRFAGPGPKQLAPFRGRPLIEHPVAALAGAGLDPVLVVLGANTAAIAAGATLAPARVVSCPDWAEGQSRALRAGVAAAAEYGAGAVVVVLGDQPLLDPAAVRAVLAARGPGADAVRATYDGTPGHPTLLEAALFGAVARLEGDAGARDLLRVASVRHVVCDGLGAPDDVDTAADLARLAAR
jgi:CTP:molybdopterin cytidylyltransferase MocA